MSYGAAGALQKAVFQALSADAALAALVGGAIFDAPPQGSVPPVYVSLGPEVVRDRSDQATGGARHDFTVSVVTDADGFMGAKTVAAAVSDVLAAEIPALERGALVALFFLKARAAREAAGTVRRIDLTFRALVDDD